MTDEVFNQPETIRINRTEPVTSWVNPVVDDQIFTTFRISALGLAIDTIAAKQGSMPGTDVLALAKSYLDFMTEDADPSSMENNALLNSFSLRETALRLMIDLMRAKKGSISETFVVQLAREYYDFIVQKERVDG